VSKEILFYGALVFIHLNKWLGSHSEQSVVFVACLCLLTRSRRLAYVTDSHHMVV